MINRTAVKTIEISNNEEKKTRKECLWTTEDQEGEREKGVVRGWETPSRE